VCTACYAIWSASSNSYWPALYVADASGQIGHRHFGEGAYDESERVIQQLLAESGVEPTDPDLDEQGNGALAEQRLYQLIRQTSPVAERRFEIEFLDSDVAAYDFTFG
jgi:hypothetical protein